MKRKTKISRKDWRNGEADFVTRRDSKTSGKKVRDYEIDDLETEDALLVEVDEEAVIRFKPKRKYA